MSIEQFKYHFSWLWYAIIKNDTVKQHGNHHSGTWGDAEQESVRVVRKQFDFIVLWIFKCVYWAI